MRFMPLALPEIELPTDSGAADRRAAGVSRAGQGSRSEIVSAKGSSGSGSTGMARQMLLALEMGSQGCQRPVGCGADGKAKRRARRRAFRQHPGRYLLSARWAVKPAKSSFFFVSSWRIMSIDASLRARM